MTWPDLTWPVWQCWDSDVRLLILVQIGMNSISLRYNMAGKSYGSLGLSKGHLAETTKTNTRYMYIYTRHVTAHAQTQTSCKPSLSADKWPAARLYLDWGRTKLRMEVGDNTFVHFVVLDYRYTNDEDNLSPCDGWLARSVNDNTSRNCRQPCAFINP